MRSNLNTRTGQIPEPQNLGAAISRHEQLTVEIARIDRQLADPAAVMRRDPREEGAWRRRAERARRYMVEEARQLAGWIDAHPETRLLQEARDLLVRLREEGVELDPPELAVVARLEAAFADAPPVRRTA